MLCFVLFIFSSTALPFVFLLRYFYRRPLTLCECLSISFPLGVVISSWIGYFLGSIFQLWISEKLCYLIIILQLSLSYFQILNCKKYCRPQNHSYKKKEKEKEEKNEKENSKNPEHNKKNEKETKNQKKNQQINNNNNNSNKNNNNGNNNSDSTTLLKLQQIILKLLIKEIRTHKMFFLIATILNFFFLILTILHFLPYNWKTKSYYTAKNCYGDLPFHLNIIKSFTKGINSEWGSLKALKFPIYSGTALIYPFITDFHTALINGGCQCTLQITLVVTAVIEFYCLLTLLYFFFQRIVRNQMASVIAIFFIISGGGFGWVYLLKGLIFNPLGKQGIGISHLFEFDYSLAIGKNRELFWFPFIDATILPQRSALLGYCLTVAILILIYHLISQNWARIKFRYTLKISILASILTGLLPFAHTHSYLIIAFITAIALILNFPFSKKYKFAIKKKYFLTICLYAILSNLIAFPQLYLFFSRVSEDNFIRFEPIWKNEWTNPISYIILSFGPIFLIGIFSLPLICNTGYKTKFLIPFVLLFIFSILIMLQPWKFDNIKLINAPYFIFALATARFVVFLLDKEFEGILYYLTTLLVIILCIIIILPVLLSIITVSAGVSEIFDQELIQMGEFVSKNTEKNATFAVPDTNFHRNPVTTLAGRQLFIGYEGWLWSHGIQPTRERKSVTNYLDKGIKYGQHQNHLKKLFAEFKITYIMDSKSKIHNSIIERFKFPKIWESENYRIFKVILN
ncbi:fgfr1 oncogene partner/lish domain-containing protein [Anaeramoeba flamelloides]|uniref:Fgfr1 oncogene partner/lish domain-containing protein n=1 Tax=Anaeramoeba flamelloides TaxID=1746091 RepID=A0ABQ8X082_9EUKA|nr:fgfr1 oncogene partner/lish domain-containing protein [Anaeramoeba flamelloides]